MTKVSAICVYCGSRFGEDPAFEVTARALGAALARRGITLVYGGGAIGLMGTVANAALDQGGTVIGIIPDHLYQREVAMKGLTELRVVDTMHVRKAEMVGRSDAFIILPGGIGTLDELVEILTWRQLGLHEKPVVLIDVGGYWRPFGRFLDHMIEAGFLNADAHGYYTLVDDVDQALASLGLTGPA